MLLRHPRPCGALRWGCPQLVCCHQCCVPDGWSLSLHSVRRRCPVSRQPIAPLHSSQLLVDGPHRAFVASIQRTRGHPVPCLREWRAAAGQQRRWTTSLGRSRQRRSPATPQAAPQPPPPIVPVRTTPPTRAPDCAIKALNPDPPPHPPPNSPLRSQGRAESPGRCLGCQARRGGQELPQWGDCGG